MGVGFMEACSLHTPDNMRAKTHPGESSGGSGEKVYVAGAKETRCIDMLMYRWQEACGGCLETNALRNGITPYFPVASGRYRADCDSARQSPFRNRSQTG